jgi:chromosome segregation ATPase
MGVTMQGESDKEVSKVGAAMVGTEFTKFKEDKQARFNVQSREFEEYTWKLRTETEQRLREAEERLARDIRTKVFSFCFAAVVSAIGAMLIGSFAATREVNNSVIALQKDVIAAQTALKTASDALVEQRQKLANAEADLILATNKSTDARSKLEATVPLLDKGRGEYEGLTKATTDALSKLQATTPLLDKARGEYEGLTKATTDARSKLQATTPLLDKARGDYEGLTKATNDARSKLQATISLLDNAQGVYEVLTKATTDARSKLEAITSLQVNVNKTVGSIISLLDITRGLYEQQTKATTDARSKLEAITPLLDKARGEYEELTKRIRVLQQPPNQ